MKRIKIKSFMVFFLVLAVSFMAAAMSINKSNDSKILNVQVNYNGSGTLEDPYRVTTAQDLYNVRYGLDKYYIQTNHIDMSVYENFPTIATQTHPFTGYYDGQQYLIYNLNMDHPNDYAVGLFEMLYNGILKNIKLKGKITGKGNVGGIAGINKGTIAQCINEADIIATESNAGGITGLNSGGIIERCANKGNIKIENGSNIGGITGVNLSSITDCYNTGNILGESIYVGGIAGVNDGITSASSIEKCYNTGSIQGNVKGQIAGDNWKAKISNALWLESKVLLPSSFNTGNITDAYSKTIEELGLKDTYKDWSNFDENWLFLIGIKTPALRCEYVKVEEINFNGGNSITMQAGEIKKLEAKVSPIHATVQNIKYTLISGGSYCEFNAETGEIKILEDTLVGSIIEIKAEAEDVSQILIIKTVKIPITKIELTNTENQKAISHSEMLKFSAKVYPQNATYKDIVFTTNYSYAIINQDGELRLSSSAPKNGEFKVTATSIDDPSKFAEYALTVSDEGIIPYTEFTVNNPSNFKITEKLELNVTAKLGNLNNPVSYDIISDLTTAAGAKINGSSLTAKGLGVIVIEISSYNYWKEDLEEFDDLYDRYRITVYAEKEPVTGFNNFSNAELFTSESLKLNAIPYPDNATFKEVIYSIGQNDIEAKLEGNVLTAKKAGTIIVTATVMDNNQNVVDYSRDILVTFKEVKIESIVLSIEGKKEPLYEAKQEASIKFNAQVYPQNATYQNITYYYKLEKGGKELPLTANPVDKFFAKVNLDDYIITIYEKAAVEKSIWLVAKSYDGKTSEIEIKIDFRYKSDIFDAMILLDSKDSKDIGLFYVSDNINKLIYKYDITIKNGTVINLSKSFYANSSGLNLLLFKNSNNLSDYIVDMVIYFNEDGNIFDYERKNIAFTSDKTNPASVKYISAAPSTQISTFNGIKDNNVIVVFDFYSTNTLSLSTVTSTDKLQLMYVYCNNSGPIHKDLNFAFNNGANNVDLYINGFDFKAGNNKHAIELKGSGTLNLFCIAYVYIRGGDGTAGNEGGAGINGNNIKININESCNLIIFGGIGGEGTGTDSYQYYVPGSGTYYETRGGLGKKGGNGITATSLTINNNGSLNIYGGTGGTGGTGQEGTKGTDGTKGSNGPNKGTDGKEGKVGMKGGNGGLGGCAISTSTLIINSTKIIYATSGGSGSGGRGGKGGRGGNGGDGGYPEWWSRPGDGGNGGTGGTGGQGGNAGSTVAAINYSQATGYEMVQSFTGAQGSGGRGGDGGDGGTGGWAYSIWWSGTGTPGKGGAAGSGGAGGTGYYSGSGGSSGTKGSDGKLYD